MFTTIGLCDVNVQSQNRQRAIQYFYNQESVSELVADLNQLN